MVRALLPGIWDALLLAVQLLLTGSLYDRTLPRRSKFMLRSVINIGLFLLLSCIIGMFPLHLSVLPLFIYALYIMLSFALYCADIKMRCFTFLSTMATHHMAVALIDALWMALNVREGSLEWAVVALIGFTLSLVGCYFLFGRKMCHISIVKLQSGRLIVLACIIFAVAYLLRICSVFEIWALEAGNPLRVTTHLYSAISCLASLTILFMSNHEDTLAEELAKMERMLLEREQQESKAVEVIDLVNMKYHDLKHILSALRTGDNPTALLDEYESELPAYENILHTGSPALDVLLTRRLNLCKAHCITLKCMVDGKELDVISSADICSLFGNLLDNAIDAVLAEQPQNRIILLQVFSKRGYLVIHEENYCSKMPILLDGLPVNNNDMHNMHGFGVKSMRSITEKYSGHLTITEDRETFSVDILIPLA